MRELSVQEVENVNGGAHPAVVFVAGAIASGVVYDAVKAGATALYQSAGKAAAEAMQRYYSELYTWQMMQAHR